MSKNNGEQYAFIFNATPITIVPTGLGILMVLCKDKQSVHDIDLYLRKKIRRTFKLL